MITASGGKALRAASIATLGAVLVSLTACADRHAPAAALPTSGAHPATIVRDGAPYQLYVRQADFDGAIVDPHNPRIVRVRYARTQENSHGRFDPCAPPVDPFAYVSKQDARSVTIDIAGYRPAPRHSGGPRAVSCDDTLVGYTLLPVRLAAPVGARSVRSLVFGEPVPVVPRDMPPAPGELPRGYVAATARFEQPDTPVRVYRHGEWELDVVVNPDPALTTGPRNADVNGHPARLQHAGNEVDISWTVSPGRVLQISDYQATRRGPGAVEAGGPPDISTAELLAVADSIR